VSIDPNSLPRDTETLRKIVVDLAERLDRSLTEQNKYQSRGDYLSKPIK
jgi:hypothetical protein